MDTAYVVTAHIPGAHEMAVRSLLTRGGAAAEYPLLSGSSDRVLKMWRVAEGTGGAVAGAQAWGRFFRAEEMCDDDTGECESGCRWIFPDL